MAVDIYTKEGRIRYNLGDTVQPYSLDEIAIVFSLKRYDTQTENKQIWLATYDCFQFLLAKLANTTSTGRREREGDVEIEEYGSSKYLQVKKAFDDFLKTSPDDSATYANVYFGGVSKTEINRVRNNSDVNSSPIQSGWTLLDD